MEELRKQLFLNLEKRDYELKFKQYLEKYNLNGLLPIGIEYNNDYPFFAYLTYGKCLNDVFKNIEHYVFTKYFELIKNVKNKKQKIESSDMIFIRKITVENLTKYLNLIDLGKLDNIFNERKLNFSELFFITDLTEKERIFILKHEYEHIKNNYFFYLLKNVSSDINITNFIVGNKDAGALLNIFSDYIINYKLSKEMEMPENNNGLIFHLINDNNIKNIFPFINLDLVHSHINDTDYLYKLFLKDLSTNQKVNKTDKYISDYSELSNVLHVYSNIIFKLKRYKRYDEINLINNFLNNYFSYMINPVTEQKTNLTSNKISFF